MKTYFRIAGHVFTILTLLISVALVLNVHSVSEELIEVSRKEIAWTVAFTFISGAMFSGLGVFYSWVSERR